VSGDAVPATNGAAVLDLQGGFAGTPIDGEVDLFTGEAFTSVGPSVPRPTQETLF
jgi:hypothetical protein